MVHEVLRFLNGEVREVDDINTEPVVYLRILLAREIHTKRFRTQALPFTYRTRLFREEGLSTKPVTVRAGTVRTIEREESRLHLRERGAVVRTDELRGERLVRTISMRYLHEPVGLLERYLERLGKALTSSIRVLLELGHEDAIHYRIDVMPLVPIQHYLLAQSMHLAVDDDALEALPEEVIEELVVLALAAYHHGRVDDDLGPVDCDAHHFPIGLAGAARDPAHDEMDHLLLGELGDRDIVVHAVRLPGTGIQHAEVVVYLGDGSHRRARVIRT